MNIKKLLFLKGTIETLNYFSTNLQHSLSSFFSDIDTHTIYDSTSGLSNKIIPSQTALISFNCIGLSGEKDYIKDSVSIWAFYNCTIINILVDHPMYYHNQLVHSDTFMNHSDSLIICCVDINHVNYIRKYYPQIKNVYFFPMAGSCPKINTSKHNVYTKKYDLIFTGNYTPPSHFEKYIDRNGPDYSAFYHNIIDDLLYDPSIPMEDVCLKHILENIPNIERSEIPEIMSKMIFIDLYVRFQLRGSIIQAIDHAQIPIHIVGKGFQYLPLKYNIIPESSTLMPTEYCLQEISNSYISLDVMPWFRNGSHDRVLSSMLCNTLSLTDSSQWLMTQFQDNIDYSVYNNCNIKKIPEIIQTLLSNKNHLTTLTQNGHKKALESHTWDSRALELSNLLLSI